MDDLCVISINLGERKMRLKSWESPRKEGRNSKGKGGTARKRQIDKRNKLLLNKLKAGN
jgi:hypothetical protein